MERSIDGFLDNIFNYPQTLWANIIFGILLVMLGIYYKYTNRSKGKKISGLLCVAIGSLTLITNIAQLFFPLF
jgi:uncharacterized membrane protein